MSAWHERPLSHAQLLYAANDAAVLLALFDALSAVAAPVPPRDAGDAGGTNNGQTEDSTVTAESCGARGVANSALPDSSSAEGSADITAAATGPAPSGISAHNGASDRQGTPAADTTDLPQPSATSPLKPPQFGPCAAARPAPAQSQSTTATVAASTTASTRPNGARGPEAQPWSPGVAAASREGTNEHTARPWTATAGVNASVMGHRRSCGVAGAFAPYVASQSTRRSRLSPLASTGPMVPPSAQPPPLESAGGLAIEEDATGSERHRAEGSVIAAVPAAASSAAVERRIGDTELQSNSRKADAAASAQAAEQEAACAVEAHASMEQLGQHLAVSSLSADQPGTTPDVEATPKSPEDGRTGTAALGQEQGAARETAEGAANVGSFPILSLSQEVLSVSDDDGESTPGSGPFSTVARWLQRRAAPSAGSVDAPGALPFEAVGPPRPPRCPFAVAEVAAAWAHTLAYEGRSFQKVGGRAVALEAAALVRPSNSCETLQTHVHP